MEKISALLKKILTKEVLLYAVFGVFTTLVNLGSFFVMNSCFRWNENLSNFIAIALAVLFAYITNKDLVFHSEAKSFKDKVFDFFEIGHGMFLLRNKKLFAAGRKMGLKKPPPRAFI